MDLDGLTDTQRTLMIPLLGRARATREGGALLHDPLAAEIADRLRQAATGVRTHRQSDLIHAVRARTMDDLIRAFLGTHPRATIVNLGAGLDTAFYRLDNGALRWIDVDLPEVIELRRRLLPQAPRVRSFAGSFLDLQWLDTVGPSPEGLFFQAAGLFVYFPRGEVRAFVDRLARKAQGAELIFDYQSTMSRLFGNAGMRSAGLGRARLRWGMNGARVLSRWSSRAEVVEAFPLFARVGTEAFESRAALRAARTMDRLRAIMIAHLRFQSDPRE